MVSSGGDGSAEARQLTPNASYQITEISNFLPLLLTRSALWSDCGRLCTLSSAYLSGGQINVEAHCLNYFKRWLCKQCCDHSVQRVKGALYIDVEIHVVGRTGRSTNKAKFGKLRKPRAYYNRPRVP